MNLNIIPNGAIKRVHVSQNDVGRTLTFELFNNSTSYTIPTGATVKIQGTKPSGFGFSETCTVSGNTVTIDTTEAMTDEFGYIDTELQITNSGDVLGTSNFVLVVEKNPHPSNTTDGTQITAQSLEVRIEALEAEMSGGGMTDDIKQALLNCFAHVAWIDANGQTYYDALEDALYPPANLVSISAVYTQSGTVYDTDTLDSLKSDLVVTAHYDNSTTQTVTSYTLSGTLTTGTSTITVAYGGKTTTFNVTVTEYVEPPVYELSAVTTFAGSTDIDTGIAPESVDRDWTINFEMIDFGSISGRRIFIMGKSANQCGIEYNQNNIRANHGDINAVLFNPSNADGTKSARFVVTHEQGSNDIVAHYSYNDGAITGSQTVTTNKSSIIDSDNLHIGGFANFGQKISGITINEFVVQYRIMDSAEITAYLGGA